MLRNVILKHFLRLVYMRAFAFYMILLFSISVCKAQVEGDLSKTYSTVNFENPKVGQIIRFNEIWNCEGPDLIVTSQTIADSLAQLIQNDPNITWEIGRFSDCRASSEYNLEYTTKRAKDLRDYFIKLGVDSSQITYKGYGETQKLNNCDCDRRDNDLGIHCTEEQHQQNRRTELKIVAVKTYPVEIIYSNINLKKPKVGQLVRFNIYHDLDQPDVARMSWPTLDSVFNIIRKINNVKWELGVHTDCRANNEYNNGLSELRGRFISYYLAEKGIDTSQITIVGYGESQLLNDCKCDRKDNDLGIHCTEEQHQQNRRTELKIIAVKKE